MALVGCDEGVLPPAARVAGVADEFELDEVVSTERQLFYVAATRARERLVVSAVGPGSEFLDDLSGLAGILGSVSRLGGLPTIARTPKQRLMPNRTGSRPARISFTPIDINS